MNQVRSGGKNIFSSLGKHSIIVCVVVEQSKYQDIKISVVHISQFLDMPPPLPIILGAEMKPTWVDTRGACVVRSVLCAVYRWRAGKCREVRA